MGNFIDLQKRKLLHSFKPDRRFIELCLLEIGLIILVVLGIFLWSRHMTSIGQDIEQLRSQIESLSGLSSSYTLQLRDNTAVEVFSKVLLSTTILALFLIAAWTLIKMRIYGKTTGKGFSWKLYWRFAIVSVLWGVISFFIFMTLQLFVYLWLGESFEFSWVSRISVFVLLLVIVITLFWFTISMFTPLVRECRILSGIKGLWNGVKSFGRFIVPLVASLIVMAAINVIMYIFLLFGKGMFFLIMSTLLLVTYITWMRFYFMSVLEHAPAARHGKETHQMHAEHPGRARLAVKS